MVQEHEFELSQDQDYDWDSEMDVPGETVTINDDGQVELP